MCDGARHKVFRPEFTTTAYYRQTHEMKDWGRNEMQIYFTLLIECYMDGSVLTTSTPAIFDSRVDLLRAHDRAGVVTTCARGEEQLAPERYYQQRDERIHLGTSRKSKEDEGFESENAPVLTRHVSRPCRFPPTISEHA